jgi:hypothetical protein
VNPPQTTPSLKASPNPVVIGKTVTLTWDTGAYDPATDPLGPCQITGPGLSPSPYPVTTQSSSVTATVNSESTYTLSCPNGTNTTVKVRVIPTGFEN